MAHAEVPLDRAGEGQAKPGPRAMGWLSAFRAAATGPPFSTWAPPGGSTSSGCSGRWERSRPCRAGASLPPTLPVTWPWRTACGPRWQAPCPGGKPGRRPRPGDGDAQPARPRHGFPPAMGHVLRDHALAAALAATGGGDRRAWPCGTCLAGHGSCSAPPTSSSGTSGPSIPGPNGWAAPKPAFSAPSLRGGPWRRRWPRRVASLMPSPLSG